MRMVRNRSKSLSASERGTSTLEYAMLASFMLLAGMAVSSMTAKVDKVFTDIELSFFDYREPGPRPSSSNPTPPPSPPDRANPNGGRV